MSDNVHLHLDKMLKILDLGFSTTNIAYTHPDRTLDWDVFLYVSKGQIEVYEENNEFVVGKGQFLFLKNNRHHWGSVQTPPGTAWYWIHFLSNTTSDTSSEYNAYLNANLSPMISKEEYNTFLDLPKYGKVQSPENLEKKLDSMINLFNSDNSFRAIYLSLQTIDLLIDIYKASNEKQQLTKTDYTVQRVIKYIEKKDCYPLDSHELSAHLDMNYSYLCEVFKAKTGNTISMYNSKVFIDKAVSMIKNSNLNISEISDSLGFNNPFYFSRVFRKVIGCSPTEYLSRIYKSW